MTASEANSRLKEIDAIFEKDLNLLTGRTIQALNAERKAILNKWFYKC